MVGVLPSLDRDRVEDVCHVLKHAGPAIAPATPALLDALRAYGVWHWPSQISRALARAAEFDDRVLPALREMLSDPDEARRTSAMQVLAHLGPRAAPAAAQLLSFRAGSEAERVQAVRALSAQGAATPELLDLLEESMNDQSGYVRRAAAQALGELKADPDRFVPLLVTACDQFPHLHDE
jgi:HEAT repeat protein